jgi:hypothetical protein
MSLDTCTAPRLVRRFNFLRIEMMANDTEDDMMSIDNLYTGSEKLQQAICHIQERLECSDFLFIGRKGLEKAMMRIITGTKEDDDVFFTTLHTLMNATSLIPSYEGLVYSATIARRILSRLAETTETVPPVSCWSEIANFGHDERGRNALIEAGAFDVVYGSVDITHLHTASREECLEVLRALRILKYPPPTMSVVLIDRVRVLSRYTQNRFPHDAEVKDLCSAGIDVYLSKSARRSRK